jgi:Na+-driven multidrug efflux pump
MPLLSRPDDRALTVESARARTSSYIYGNILMLAATVGVSSSDISHGAAVVTVLGTAVTTFLAHVLSHVVSRRIGNEDSEDASESVREILRDAMPIVTSGLVPVVLLGAAWLGWIPESAAQVASSIVLIVRIGIVGLLIQRLSGRKASFVALWSGVGIAVLALLIVVLKLEFTH